MIRLDSALRSLELVLAGAVATTQPSFVVSWSDATAGGYVGGTTVGAANNTTAVTLVAAPAASTVRDVDYMSVRNRDTAATTVIIRYDDSGTEYELVRVILAANDVLQYTHGSGWQVTDGSGNLKTGVNTSLLVAKTSPTGSALIPVGTTAQRDGTGDGYLRYNSTTLQFEGYFNGNWQSVGGGQLLGNALIKAIFYNSTTIGEDLTIAAGTNGMTAGPITVNDGFTVTISDGSVWSVM